MSDAIGIIIGVSVALGAVTAGILLGKRHADRSAAVWIETFVVNFPGRCPICSFHRFGLQNGCTRKRYADPHPNCPEGRP